jgi:hypothetical protein
MIDEDAKAIREALARNRGGLAGTEQDGGPD